MATTNTVKKIKKTKKIVQKWQVHVFASFNNTLVSVTDEKGNVLTWASWGSAWFKWARESTPYAAQVAAEKAIVKAKSLHSIEVVDVYVKWIGSGREQAIRWIIAWWVELKAIFDITPIPHNWCRKKKTRSL
jgi:small subunit ribosomal protein S11